MNRIRQIIALNIIAVAMLTGCIETDFEDPIGEQINLSIPEGAVFRVNWGIDLAAEFRDANGTVDPDADFIFTSSDSSILAVVDGKGVGRAPGEATITATLAGGDSNTVAGELTVNVLESREQVDITNKIDDLGVGQSFIFTVNYIDPKGEATSTPIVWTSANPEIATVSQTGVVTGVSEGEVEITVTAGFSEDNVTLNILGAEVVFEPEVSIVTFRSVFSVGNSFTFEADFIDETGAVVDEAPIVWSSTDEAVATVDESGLVNAISQGTSNIVATSGNVSAFIEITVESMEEMRRSGELKGIRGYNYSGSFSLFVNAENQLILSFENVVLDRGAPGPYWYLSNQETGIANGIELGAAQSGNFEINVTERFPEVGINTFSNFVIWCKPFGIPLGVGEYDE